MRRAQEPNEAIDHAKLSRLRNVCWKVPLVSRR